MSNNDCPFSTNLLMSCLWFLYHKIDHKRLTCWFFFFLINYEGGWQTNEQEAKRGRQCDQMSQYKLPNFPHYWPKSSQIIFYINRVLFKIAQKFTRTFGLIFCKKICYQKVKKIAKSGHTGVDLRNWNIDKNQFSNDDE